MKRSLSLSALLVLTMALAGANAHAHSMVSSSTPSDGATVAASPASIEVAFSAPMRTVNVTLSRADGTAYDVSAVGGRSASDRLAVELPPLPAGDYQLEWRGLSGDGHTLSETLTFTISGS